MIRPINRTLCPHCGKACYTVKTEQLSPTCREVMYACEDTAGCGHVFVATITPARTIAPSKNPNPSIHIPMSTAPRKATAS